MFNNKLNNIIGLINDLNDKTNDSIYDSNKDEYEISL